MAHQRDYLSKESAEHLAAQLRAYWRERGLIIRTWIEEVTGSGAKDRHVYAVRSDLDLKLLGVKPGKVAVRET